MNRPLVSCIVPVCNGERYLTEALDSIARQTYAPVEIIVVDDGSTDRTGEIVRGFGHGIRYQYQANAGQAAARNTGIELAQGKFLAFLDADDLWLEHKIETQMASLASDTGVDLCLCHLQNFWESELAAEAKRFSGHRLSAPIAAYSSVTLLARRKAFEDVGLYNSELDHGVDIDWFLRSRNAGLTTCMLDVVLVHRRLHATNRSRRLADSSRRTVLEIVRASINQRRQNGSTTT